MKKHLLLICFITTFHSLFAYDLNSVFMAFPDVVYPGEPFDMDWGATISITSNENGSSQDIKANFYLSKDPILDGNDILVVSQIFKSTSSTGFFNKALYGAVVNPEANFPAGKWYFLISVDPENTIAESNEKNNVNYYSIIVGNRNPDLAVYDIYAGKAPESGFLNIKPLFYNPSVSSFSSFKYVVKIAASEQGFSQPLFEQTYEGGEFKQTSEVKTFKKTIAIPQGLNLNNPFYVSVSIKSSTPGDESNLNDSLVKKIVWSELGTLTFYETDLVMKNRNDSVYTCSAQIFDDGGQFGSYSHNIESTIRIFPKDPNSMIQLTLKPNFGLFAFGDAISIINPDDNSTIATLLMMDSNGSTKTFLAGSSDGSIILKFETDDENINSGFEIIANCVPKQVKMGYKKKTSITTCGSAVTDNGLSSAYQSSAADEITIYPELGGDKVKLSFSLFDTEANYDFLSVYNGNSKTAPLIKKLSGSALPADITSTAPDGSLTLYFESDGSRTYAGFVANVSCTSVLSLDRNKDKIAESLNVVPNPNNGNFRLNLNTDHDVFNIHSVSIYDSKGQRVYTNAGNIEEEMNLKSLLQPGFYMLKVEDSENASVYERFIVE